MSLDYVQRQAAKKFKQTFNPVARFPIIKWIKIYNFSKLQRDIIAGLTVTLTLLPQALAYGQQAGLPSAYGLYSSFTPPISYTFLGTSKDITNGPTAIMSTLIASFAKAPPEANLTLNPQYEGGSSPTQAILLAFFAGIVLQLR